MRFEGHTENEARKNPFASFEWVAPNYFRVMGIPILRGRAFTEADRLGSERVAIVNESIANRYWPGEDPIGKRLGDPSKSMRIVGVVANTRYRELRRSWDRIFFSLYQNPFGDNLTRHPFSVPRYLVVHTVLEPQRALTPIL